MDNGYTVFRDHKKITGYIIRVRKINSYFFMYSQILQVILSNKSYTLDIVILVPVNQYRLVKLPFISHKSADQILYGGINQVDNGKFIDEVFKNRKGRF